MASRTDIIADVAQTLGVSKVKAGEQVNAVIEAIAQRLASKEDVAFKGFGSFKVRKTAARTGRNPQTGAPLEIAAGEKIVFKSFA